MKSPKNDKRANNAERRSYRSQCVEEVNRDLENIRKKLANAPLPRARNCIFLYLVAVYRVAWRWRKKGELPNNITIARKLSGQTIDPRIHGAMRVIIELTIGPNADARLKWKYATALKYARQWKVRPSEVAELIKERGGLNQCIEKYGKSKKHVKKDTAGNYTVSLTPQAKVPARLITISTAQANYSAPPRMPPPLPAKTELGRSREMISEDFSFAPWWVAAR
jgi:hypothetical protein